MKVFANSASSFSGVVPYNIACEDIHSICVIEKRYQVGGWMTNEQFEALVSRLEQQAQSKPRRYQLKVLLLAISRRHRRRPKRLVPPTSLAAILLNAIGRKFTNRPMNNRYPVSRPISAWVAVSPRNWTKNRPKHGWIRRWPAKRTRMILTPRLMIASKRLMNLHTWHLQP